MDKHVSLLAAVLASTATWAEPNNEIPGVASNISMVLNKNSWWDVDTIWLMEAEMKLEIKKQIREWIKNYKYGETERELSDFYWKGAFDGKCNEIIGFIWASPDKYWRYDSKWKFSIYDRNESLDNKDEIVKLFNRVFSEYVMEAEMKLEIKKQIREWIKNGRMEERQLLEFYWEDVFADKINEFLCSVWESPNNLIYDSKWNLSIYDKDGKLVNEDKIKKLFNRIFSEYAVKEAKIEWRNETLAFEGLVLSIFSLVTIIAKKRWK